MNVLVTGGAGYVGSGVCEALQQAGHKVVVFDSLVQGHKEAVLPGAALVIGDLADQRALKDAMTRYAIDAVMHMAAETVVAYSVSDPSRYFHNNVLGGINLLEAMRAQGVKRIVFSSSAAVYGEPARTPIKEEDTKDPVNSYGETKLIFEQTLRWYGRAYGIQHVSMRYFNVAGASERLGEDHRPETHLIPNVLKAALDPAVRLQIFGSDYPTKDGSCVRDYVHVKDIAQAHELALVALDRLSGEAFNLGSGVGYSNLEVVAAARRVTGKAIPVEMQPRRAGDPAVLLTSNEKAAGELHWKPAHSGIDEIISSAWQWFSRHPKGYSA